MQPISRPVWRPGRYVLLARDRYGRTLRVSVDARMGEVISAVPVDTYADVAPRGYYAPYPRAYGYPRESYPLAARPMPPANVPDLGESEDEYDDGGLPPPDAVPQVIPGPRSAAPSSSKSAALSPKPEARKTPPLPRARPTDMTASIANSANAQPAKPAQPASSTPASSAEAKKDIRVIDMSKPKPAPDAKTAAAEPKVAPVETKPAETKAESGAKPLEDPSAKPRF
jgi:hypothetical protein